jgi:hypothetical protein
MFTGRLSRANFTIAFFIQFTIILGITVFFVLPMVMAQQEQARERARAALDQQEALRQQELQLINADSTQ